MHPLDSRRIAAALALSGVAACAGAKRTEPPSPKTIQGAIRYDGRGQSSVVVANGSAMPIVITSLRISACQNVAFGCDSTSPGISIAPGTTQVVGRVQAKGHERPRFQYYYTWRAVSQRSPLAFVPGRESPALAARASGTIVMAQPMARLEIVTLPGKTRRVVERELWQAYSLDGPDSAGVIALATDSTDWTEHALRLRYPDGREQVLARRPGGILWHHAIGPVALAPVGGRIAVVRKPGDNVNNYRPLDVGTLEVWDAESGQFRQLESRALGQKPSWFPDGRRLAFVVTLSGSNVDRRLVILDVTTGERTSVGPGDFPVVSSDGRTMLARQMDGSVALLDVATQSKKVVTLPGNLAPPLALIDSRYVVFRALPTEGMPTDTTISNSPLVGPKAMQAVKLLDIQTGEFVTLIDLVDPRRAISVTLRLR